MIVFCAGKQRRNLVLATMGLNGLDYLEVLGAPGCGDKLALAFLKPAAGLKLKKENFTLTGDTVIQVEYVHPPTKDDPLTVTLELSGTGDFSPYTLTLVTSQTNNDAPPGIDPLLNSATFSFKAGCPTPVDCLQPQCCPSNLASPPDIHYLARDYDGFKQAILDRMAVLVPDWSETHEADPGIAMAEALAYAADRVSYLQDAINTEAYIGTARSRISLRRHARLVDYQVAEGSNARVWVALSTNAAGIIVPAGTQIYPLIPGLPASVDPNLKVAAADLLQASPGPVFETMEDITLFIEQSQMDFYSWNQSGCCLPVGATQAMLEGVFTSLQAGQVLIFEEKKGPLTGDQADADPTHRWAVRLTYASTTDLSGKPLVDPVDRCIPLTNIKWNSADALPFPLCISSVSSQGLPISGVSVALGNVVAADQGVWTVNQSLGTVPPDPAAAVSDIGCNCTAVPGAATPSPRFEPVLANSPLTFAAPYTTNVPAAQKPSASSFLSPDPAAATPQISLTSDDGQDWTPTEDLLSKDGEFPGFIPEIEWDNTAHLRFGDGTYGQSVTSGVSFTATYRTGNGALGNVGRDALAHILMPGGAGINGVRNPLPAAGGVDSETMQHIVQIAPFAFQTQMRCVTAADYGALAQTLAGVSQAQGTLRWTGSWYTAFVSVDPVGQWSSDLASAVKKGLDMLRMMGTDLVVEQAVFVGLKVGLEICVAPGFFRGDVYQTLWKVLVTGDSCAGTPGLLSGANFKFGQTVFSSPIVAAAQAVTGVVAVTLTTFERMDQPTPAGQPPPTQLLMGATEIACCDNDPNHGDRGFLTLTMDGGK